MVKSTAEKTIPYSWKSEIHTHVGRASLYDEHSIKEFLKQYFLD